MRLTLEMLDGLRKEFSLDDKRLYVTGLSMGGYGTWDAIERQPALFAAAVPVCGGGDEALAARIKATIRANLSARHVPDEIFAIPDIPRTLSGKKMELPIKKILLGTPPERAANPDSMSNPHILGYFAEMAARRNAGE
jgi:pimeloyl-ACP methyl ester carboxylesterase